MAIKKTDAGWLVDIQPGGRGSKRYRKTFGTKGEALAYANRILQLIEQAKLLAYTGTNN